MKNGLGVLCLTDEETLKALEVFIQYGYDYASRAHNPNKNYAVFHYIHIDGKELAGNYKPRTDTSNGITYLPYQEFMAKYSKSDKIKLLGKINAFRNT